MLIDDAKATRPTLNAATTYLLAAGSSPDYGLVLACALQKTDVLCGLLNATIQFDISSLIDRLLYDLRKCISLSHDHARGMMAKVEIYTSIMCPYCSRAIRLLQSKNVSFEQIDVSMSGALRQTMRSRAGGSTSVPQIFIDNEHIGGCDDLMALEFTGNLDVLLNRSAS